MANVKIYTLPTCSQCARAKSLLKQRNISFDEIVLDEKDETAWEDLEERSGKNAVPQVFYKDKFIGGESELEALDQKDHLKSLMA